MKRKTRNTIGVLIIVGVLTAVIISSMMSSYKFYYSVDEVLSKADELVGKDIKIAGDVVEGTVILKNAGSGATFSMTGNKGLLNVDYSGQVPDTFKDGIPVVIEGKLIDKSNIKADSLLTKCASKYEEKLGK